MSKATMKYLTERKPLSQIAREKAEQMEAQNVDLYEAVAGLFEEVAELTARIETLEGEQTK